MLRSMLPLLFTLGSGCAYTFGSGLTAGFLDEAQGKGRSDRFLSRVTPERTTTSKSSYARSAIGAVAGLGGITVWPPAA